VSDIKIELGNNARINGSVVAAEKAQAVENMAKHADTFVTESKSEKPEECYQPSFKSIKEAA
jgi:hypothetical protein